MQNAGVLFKTKKVGLGILLKRNSQGETYIHALLPGFAGAESGEVQVDDIIVTIDNQVLLEKVVDEAVDEAVDEVVDEVLCGLTVNALECRQLGLGRYQAAHCRRRGVSL